MIKKLLAPAFLFLIGLGASAQIGTYPSTESFDAVFTEGQDVVFIPNWTGNRVNPTATATRIYRDETDFNSAPAAMSIIPTAAFTGNVTVSLDMTSISSLNVGFAAKAMANGNGSRNTVLEMEASIDGGATWIGNREVLSLPNEDQADFQQYNYILPLAAANQPSVLLHFLVSRGTDGTGTPARIVIDDVVFSENTATVLETDVTALAFSQLQGTPSATQPVQVNAGNLTGDINIVATTDFEISLQPDAGFTDTITLPETADFLGPVAIYVRLNAAAAGSYTGTVTISSPGAASRIVDLSGTATAVTVTNPAPLVLPGPIGSAVLESWDASSPAGSFPDHMAFWTHNVNDPGLDVSYIDDWHCPYDLSNRARFIGQGADGISFVSAANSQFTGVCDGSDPTQSSGETIAAGKPGAIVLSLETLSLQTGNPNQVNDDIVVVEWTARTIAQNSRIYGLRMQYRIGDGNGNPNAGWTEFANPQDYIVGETGTSETRFTDLPSDCIGQPLVQVRWVYYYISGTGARPNLGLDDVRVTVITLLDTPELEHRKAFGFYPNPATANTIFFNAPSDVTVSDVSGKIIKTAANASTLYVGDLNPGLYFISNNEGKVLKMIR
ncbi:T9SS type A sorting domain-containing protein [Flavobacterium magnum]|nr:T9SS type A sorting domain-containing protein [Flavobacterium magnum]